MRFFPLLVLVFATSCSWIPGSVVRVAAPAEVQATPAWERLVAAWPAGSVEVVTPGSFPPADLVWFDAGAEPSEHALAANASVEALGREAGIPAVWFAAGERVFPVAWNPWAWWKGDPGSLAPTPTDQAAARVLGFVWDERGWNAAKVPALLQALWAAPVQNLWAADPDWIPVAKLTGTKPPKTLLLVR